MWKSGTVATLVCLSAFAQTAGQTITADPGVVAVRLIDRAEVRASRIEIQPGAARRVHSHTDVRFHLFVGIKGTVQLTIGSEKPVNVKPGETYFLNVGTPHGFKNLSSEPAVAMEIFVKDTGVPIAQNPFVTLAGLQISASSPISSDLDLAPPGLSGQK